MKVDGACHGDDLGYLFYQNIPALRSAFNLALDSKEFELIKAMISMVTSFMIYGKPDNDEWQHLTNASLLKCWNILNDSSEFIPLPELERMKVLDEILDEAQRFKKSKLNNKL